MMTYFDELPEYVKPAQPPAPPRPAENASVARFYKLDLPSLVLRCTRCKGEGHVFSRGFFGRDADTGREFSFPCKWSKCHCCDGAGWFHAPDLGQLIEQVKGRKGLRSKRPDGDRAYYVWRLCRFHGGKDTTMPIGAQTMVTGDPYVFILEELSKVLAKSFYGSANVGTARWHQAMYGSHDFDDVPSIIDGPVHDGNKPIEEMLEAI